MCAECRSEFNGMGPFGTERIGPSKTERESETACFKWRVLKHDPGSGK